MPGLASGLPTRAVQAGRAQVDEVVQAEAQLEQHLAFDDAGRDAGVAGGRPDGAEEDGIAGTQVCEDLVRQGLASLQPVLGTELVVGLLKHDAFGGDGLFEDLEGFGDDLRADAVARDDCEIDGGCAHSSQVSQAIHMLVKLSHSANTPTSH